MTLTTAEKRSVLALHDALRPRLNADAFRAAARASRDQHGDDRHELVKVAAMHCSASQIKRWTKEVA